MGEKYGFVYVWRDRKNKMFYVGCHWGSESDSYVCSSERMRSAYRRRPADFKRRIVARVRGSRTELLTEEHRWLSQIKDEELGKKFYNLNKHHFGHWTASNRSDEVAAKLSAKNRGKAMSEETKQKIRDSVKKSWAGSEDRKESLRKRTVESNKTRVITIEERQRLANIAKGNKNMLGKKHSDAARKSMSDKHKVLSRELNYAARFNK